MFDLFSWSHILILLTVALVVVGPKDLPRLMNIAGRWAGKARNMANEFKRSFDDMARQSELDELRAEVEKLRSTDPVADRSARERADRHRREEGEEIHLRCLHPDVESFHQIELQVGLHARHVEILREQKNGQDDERGPDAQARRVVAVFVGQVAQLGPPERGLAHLEHRR